MTLRIKLVSDLHLEFSSLTIPNDNNYDLLILSGDIMVAEWLHKYQPTDAVVSNSSYAETTREFREFLTQVSNDFPKVIYVAGNHELYHGKFFAGIEYLYEECQSYPNIFFLEKNYHIIDDIAFIGATLWTDCDQCDPLTMYNIQSAVNDYRLIRHDKDNYRKVRPIDTIKRHQESLEYFQNTINKLKGDGISRFVIVGHHSPSFLSVHQKYKSDDINGAYHSKLDSFILDNPEIELWTHGHTHHPFDYKIGDTRIVCNPRGYEGASYNENTGWNPNILIEI